MKIRSKVNWSDGDKSELLIDYNPCAECYPRTEEGCNHCYVNGG